jgi:stalled ribosome rescue protein Dom34
MKINTSNLRPGQEGTVHIKTNSDSDYQTLASVIVPGDELETTIRTKENDRRPGKKTVSFMQAIVTVEKVVGDGATVNVVGQYRPINGGKGGRTSIWLTDGCTFSLKKRSWSAEVIRVLTGENTEVSATLAVVEKAMLQLRELIATDPDLLTFGDNAFYVVDRGAANILLVTENALARLPKDKQNGMTMCNRKYRGADVFILKNDSQFHNEIQMYGGIVAILKYRFNPDDCFY